MIVIVVSGMLLGLMGCVLNRLDSSWNKPQVGAEQNKGGGKTETGFLACLWNTLSFSKAEAATIDHPSAGNSEAGKEQKEEDATGSPPPVESDCQALYDLLLGPHNNQAKSPEELMDKLAKCNPQINIRIDPADSKKNLIQITIPSALQRQLVNASIESVNKRHATIDRLISAAEKEKPGDTMARKFHKVVIAAISLVLLTILVAAIWHVFALFLKKDNWQSPTLLEDKEKDGGDKKSGISANIAAFIPLFFVAGGTSLVGYHSLVADAMAMPATSMLQTLGSGDSLNGASQLAAMANSLNNTTHIEIKPPPAVDSSETKGAIDSLAALTREHIKLVSNHATSDHENTKALIQQNGKNQDLINGAITALDKSKVSFDDWLKRQPQVKEDVNLQLINNLTSSVARVEAKIAGLSDKVEKSKYTSADSVLTGMVINNLYEIDRLKNGTVKTNGYSDPTQGPINFTVPGCRWTSQSPDANLTVNAAIECGKQQFTLSKKSETASGGTE